MAPQEIRSCEEIVTFFNRRATVGDLRKALEGLPDELLIGAEDSDEVVCDVAWAGATFNDTTGDQYFLIRARGGFPLFEEQ